MTEEEKQLGEKVKEIYENAEEVAKLHKTLTSRRGNYFRKRLLHKLRRSSSKEEIREFKDEVGVRECQRHLDKLMNFYLVRHKRKSPDQYSRTRQGLNAINAVRALERRAGREEAEKIYEADIGPNTVRLFLKVYGSDKEIDLESLEVKITPADLGRLALFLPRTVEGIASIEKLDDAGFLSHRENGHFHFDARLARSFFQYLSRLHKITQAP